MSDLVNSPSHYTKRAATIEPIDVLRMCPFSLGCCLKYVFRVGLKDEAVIDWRKAQRYLRWAVEDYARLPDYFDWYLNHYGHLLSKFETFQGFTTSSASILFLELDALIEQNLKRLG